jgi:predicted phage gp36 major capsid-like protein
VKHKVKRIHFVAHNDAQRDRAALGGRAANADEACREA